MVSGVDKDELLYLEISFLKLIDFQLLVDPDTFENYYNHLVKISERKAVLWNWSWLDPAHCSQVSRKEHSTRNQTYQDSEVRLKEDSDNVHTINIIENTCFLNHSVLKNKPEQTNKTEKYTTSMNGEKLKTENEFKVTPDKGLRLQDNCSNSSTSKVQTSLHFSRDTCSFEYKPNTHDRLSSKSDSIDTNYTTSDYPSCNYDKYNSTFHVGSQSHRPCF